MAVACTVPSGGGHSARVWRAEPTDYRESRIVGGVPERHRAARAAFLAQFPLFATLSETERRTLVEASGVRTFKPGEVLFHEGDPGHTLYLLQAGRVKIVLVAPDGRETIL